MPSEPATKADLAELKTYFRAELDASIAKLRQEMATKTDLTDAIAYLKAEITAEITAVMSAEMARQIKASAEESRQWFAVLANKLDGAAANHTQLRDDFERHRDDKTVHRAPRRSRAR